MEGIDEALAPPRSDHANESFVNKLGLKKKLVKAGRGWESPELGDEITVSYTATVLGETVFTSSVDNENSAVLIVGKDHILKVCYDGIVTMRKGEISIFTVPPSLAREIHDQFPGLPPGASLQVQVELISLLKVIPVNKLGLKKKVVKVGHGWEFPEVGDEITVNYAATILGGGEFTSDVEKGNSVVFTMGNDSILKVCEDGLATMRKGEIAILTMPPTLFREIHDQFPSLPPDAYLQFQVELISLFKVIDVCNEGGIIKKILVKGDELEKPQKKDEVTVIYEVILEDGSLVAKSPVEGVEFLVSDGHLCPAIEKTVCTMRKGEQARLRVQPRYAFGARGRSAQDGLSAVSSNVIVNISLTLVGYKLLEYVTDDQLIIKKITSWGRGFEKPNSGTTAHIRYVAKLSDGKIFDKKGMDGEDPFIYKVDEEQVIEGLDLAVATMRRGEVSLIIINPDYGFGDVEITTTLAVVPARSTLYYEVEMLGFTKVKEAYDMEPEEKLEYAAKRKEEGNAYFKAGNYRRAALRYSMAAKYVEFDALFSREQKNLGKFLTVSCNLNTAACQLKLKDFEEVVKRCSEVLKLEPSNIKALFRRAQAYMERTDLVLAELDLEKATEIDPNNREVMQLQRQLKKLQAFYDKKETNRFAEMISKLKI